MKTIFIRNGEIRKKPVALLEFPFDQQLIDLVRTIPNAEWQPDLRAWAVPYSDGLIDRLLSLFRGQAWLNYTEFKRVKLESTARPISLPVLSENLIEEIAKFSDWMRNRRYSESTIKNYSQGIGLFFSLYGKQKSRINYQ